MCSKHGIAKPVFSAFFLLDSESSPDPVCPDLVGIRPVALWQFRFYRVGGRFTAGSGMAEAVMPMMMLNNRSRKRV